MYNNIYREFCVRECCVHLAIWSIGSSVQDRSRSQLYFCHPASRQWSFLPPSMSQPQSGFLLNGLPLKPSEVPSEDAVLAAGKEILAASSSWKQGKTYQKVVKTCTYSPSPKSGDGTKWACRVSEHTREDGTFDDFWSGLGTNKAENEMQ